MADPADHLAQPMTQPLRLLPLRLLRLARLARLARRARRVRLVLVRDDERELLVPLLKEGDLVAQLEHLHRRLPAHELRPLVLLPRLLVGQPRLVRVGVRARAGIRAWD